MVRKLIDEHGGNVAAAISLAGMLTLAGVFLWFGAANWSVDPAGGALAILAGGVLAYIFIVFARLFAGELRAYLPEPSRSYRAEQVNGKNEVVMYSGRKRSVLAHFHSSEMAEGVAAILDKFHNNKGA